MDTVISTVNSLGVATLTINRPERSNSLDDTVIYSMVTALDDLAKRKDVKILLLNSVGKHFSTGIDTTWLSEAKADSNRLDQHTDQQLARLFYTLYNFPHPTICEVKGRVYSESMGLLACCDIVIAAKNVKFILNDIHFGTPPLLSTPFLTKILGERAMKYYALTSESINANKALDLGLISLVISDESNDPSSCDGMENMAKETIAIIQKLLKQNTVAASEQKAFIQYCASEPFDEMQQELSLELLDKIKSKTEYQFGLNVFGFEEN